METADGERRTRRWAIRGAMGGVAAVLGGIVGRPTKAVAAATTDPGAVHKGVNNLTSAITMVTCTNTTALKGVTQASSGKRSGVLGQSGPGDGRGVTGLGPIGVLGQTGSPTGIGSWGLANGPSAIGVFGRNDAATGNAVGVRGESHSEDGSGVFGIATSTAGAGVQGRANGLGVFGRSDDALGIGVQGTGGAFGVKGFATEANGVAVFGHASGATGIGGQFEASGAAGSLGLSVLGRAEFSTAGVTSVAAGAAQVLVTPGVELTSNSKVLATLQSDGGVAVGWVELDTGANRFTVHFTANTSQACSVAWFVIG
jgi:hypothetical protein